MAARADDPIEPSRPGDEDPLRIAVVMGGASGEHSISLRSAATVTHALEAAGHEVVALGVTPAGVWRSADFRDLLERARTELVELEESIGVAVTLARTPDGVTTLPLEGGRPPTGAPIDCVFPIVHGPGGEDGTLQGLFELLEVPFVGAGCRASALAMDKIATKALCAGAGIAQVEFLDATARDVADLAGAIEASFGYPCFVKPSALGSSVGISRVDEAADLARALEEARRWDRRVIVEQGRDVREIELALIGQHEPEFSPPGEIIVSGEFYDFDSKYVDDSAELVAGAEVDAAQLAELHRIARDYWRLIGCTGLARADFFIDRATGSVLFNEFNTLPGFTPISMYPRLWREAGVEIDELVARLVKLAVATSFDAPRDRHVALA